LKALAKRASERHSTAKDMADDLRHFLTGQTPDQQSGGERRDGGSPSTTPTPAVVSGCAGTSSSTAKTTADSQPLKVIPKGLRSFDAHDAEFFLELLPGPRDREGLPDSIRFWKTRIEERDADSTFSISLIYGPSGCGKSSLVKAGLLPRLSPDVIAVYVEATAEGTETRLLHGLRKRCPALPDNRRLKETMAALRRGQGVPAGQKVLIVLDQFEQWLHARKDKENTELVQALRQCDGGRLQTVVMVRDDFWLAVSRFMKALEVRLLEGHNSALVDLFDVDHARKVLAAFGRAFGRLPEGTPEKDQKEFLNLAVSGLAQEGKVISVRLALFAEMLKGKPWTPATLKAVGGTQGVGVTFLEETFSAATAPPEHRYHQKAARAIMKVLLPDAGSHIRGHMRSHAELLAASGYGNCPREFDDLLRILDSELRLVTPIDPEGAGEGSLPVPAGEKYYQLTHDYLVHSLRDWLTRKQKETRRGRAELLLEDRASVWNIRPENRQLPSLLQWLQIRCLTQKQNWTPPQRKMMGKATRYHAVRGFVVALLLALIGWGAYEGHGRLQAHALRDRLLDANIADVPTIVQDMAPYRHWLDPLLHDAQAQADQDNDRRKQLHASLALLPVDATQVDFLCGRLLDAEPHEVPVIRDALAPHKDGLLDKLWAVVESPEQGKEEQRLRAAAALAKYDPESKKWTTAQEAVSNDLVRVPAVYLAIWMEALRPVRVKLLMQLSAVHRDATRREVERSLATDILADYAAAQPQLLANLLMDADEKQFAVIYPKLKERGDQGVPLLTAEIDKKLPSDLPSSDDKREKLAKRQANAAVALLRMNQPEKVWPLLKHSPDPRVRSYLIHRLSPLGADAGAISKRLDEEPDLTIRQALILSLGEFSEKELPLYERQALLPRLQDIYRTDADPGLHASAEWLLRTWQQEAWLKQVNDEWAKDKEEREKRLASLQRLLSKDKEKVPPHWYVNGQGQTMVVIPGPVVFAMGSPLTEVRRPDNERQHKKRIGRTFAVSAKLVTVEQYQRFDKAYKPHTAFTRMADLPIGGIKWYEAAAYCNWLSRQERIPEDQWCYEAKDGQVTRLKDNYLSLAGYRLSTEAEMEYATRAGTVTARHFGESADLLPKYAWYRDNANELMWPVGSLKPNDLGFFDVHGNLLTWCQESFKEYSQTDELNLSEDKEDRFEIIGTVGRVLRGGSFNSRATKVRSAIRGALSPGIRFDDTGFRLARTLPIGFVMSFPPASK
jgi:formylglycine-generating enzyme required for sulfatase activity